MKFGDFFRQKRLNLKLTLRSFCERYGFDPAYISRLENNVIKPPREDSKLQALAISLQLKKETEEWVIFFDLAYTANEEISKDIKKAIPDLNSLLPAFLRTSNNKKISGEKAKELIDFLKKGGNSTRHE